MKENFLIFCGGIVGIISQIVGGFDKMIIGLLVVMGIDYITGLIKAFCGKSGKTKNGHLSSKAGFIGILKKITMVLIVAMGYFIDNMFELSGIRDMIITAFFLNDCISILENTSAIGVKYPEKLKNVLESLQESED